MYTPVPCSANRVIGWCSSTDESAVLRHTWQYSANASYAVNAKLSRSFILFWANVLYHPQNPIFERPIYGITGLIIGVKNLMDEFFWGWRNLIPTAGRI